MHTVTARGGLRTSAWWARGLALHERDAGRAAGAQPPAAGVDPRLESWRACHGGTAALTDRLLVAGVDEATLRALLAEPTDALARRCVRPGWVGRVEDSLAADLPAATGSSTTDGAGVLVFADVVRPLVSAAARQARARTDAAPDLDATGLLRDFAAALTTVLATLSAKTLVLELNARRLRGELVGDTGAERFADFLRQVATADGLATLFAEYPVLARILEQAARQFVDAYAELLDRFLADRPVIVSALLTGVDPGALMAVEFGRGDRHGGGRSVAVLRFARGTRLVYKPRSLELQECFTGLVGWLNAAVPELDLRTARCLPRDGYGWTEFVDHTPCADLAGVDRFYRRQGALLALLYAVDATDVHYDNLVAHADQPVLVDVETLFHPTLPLAVATGSDPAISALARSVGRTALLPMMMFGEHGALDISGMGGDQRATFPTDVVRWENEGTDTMRLVRGATEFTGGVNRPVLAGRAADPGQHVAALLAGFRAGYDAIAGRRAEWTGPGGLVQRCARAQSRIVPRHTHSYLTLLDESTHPDVLRDGLDRDLLFETLWTQVTDPRLLALVGHEVADLWAGDVPIFVSRPDSRDLWTSRGVRLPEVFDLSGVDSVRAKIELMGDGDRREQEWLIAATLASRTEGPVHAGVEAITAPVVAAVADPQRLLRAACGIGDEIVATARHDAHRANWLGLELLDGRHWTVLPMGAGLAEGYPGVALFLAQLGALTGINRYSDLARESLRPLPLLIEALRSDRELASAVGCGAFTGAGGIGYALARLAALLDDRQILGWVDSVVELTAFADTGAHSSVASGHAGGLAAMLAVHAQTGLDSAARLADRFAERLLTGQEPLGRRGFVAGAAGIGWALRRYADHGGGAQHTEAARSAFAADPMPPPSAADHGWCSGLAGAVLARCAPPGESPGLSLSEQQAADAAAKLTARPPLRDSSLCHGELGVLEALLVLGGRHSDAARRRGALLLGAIEQYGLRMATPDGVPTPGLLTGLAGIGYGLLRLGFTDRVPSVLLLDAAPDTTGPRQVPSNATPRGET